MKVRSPPGLVVSGRVCPLSDGLAIGLVDRFSQVKEMEICLLAMRLLGCMSRK